VGGLARPRHAARRGTASELETASHGRGAARRSGFWPFTRSGSSPSGGSNTPPAPAPKKAPFRLSTYNVFYNNTRTWDLAKLISMEVSPDIISFTEAIGEVPQQIVDQLNLRQNGTWVLANKWDRRWMWCGLVAYRSDRWESTWHTQIPISQSGNPRGVCGAALKRKSDGEKLCVFGAHPAFASGGPPKWAKHAIKAAAAQMRNCSESFDAPVVFMCDCNTMNHVAVTAALTNATGSRFELAYGEWYDQIHIEAYPRRVGNAHGGFTVGKKAGKRYCKQDCQLEEWGFSDHPVPYVDITPS